MFSVPVACFFSNYYYYFASRKALYIQAIKDMDDQSIERRQ
jgi:hypothetical protein